MGELRRQEVWAAKYVMGDDGDILATPQILHVLKVLKHLETGNDKHRTKILKKIKSAKITEKQLLNEEKQRKDKASRAQTNKSIKHKVDKVEGSESEDPESNIEHEEAIPDEDLSVTRTLQHVALEEIEKQNEQKARRFHALYMEALARGEYDISEGTSSEPENSCVVCLDRPAETKFLPCGQKLCCRICAENIAGHEVFNKCPFCREVVTGLD